MMRAGSPRDTNRGLLLGLVAAAVVAVLPYVQTATFGFLSWDDDIHIYANPWLLAAQWWRFWLQPYTGLYVPVPYTIWTMIHLVSPHPSMFHMANIVMHAINTALVVVLVRRVLMKGPGVESRRSDLMSVLVGGLSFGLHPVQTEAVAWVAGFRDLSCGFFALLAILTYLSATSWRGYRYALSLCFFVLSLLCKPNSVMLPAGILCLELVARGRDLKSSLRALAPWLAVAALFVAVTAQVQAESITPTLAAIGLAQRGLVALDAIGFYVLKLAVPLTQFADYGRTSEMVLAQASWVYAAVGGGLIFSGIIAALVGWRGALLSGAALGLCLLLPTSGGVPFAFQRVSTVADRYMYLPMIGCAIVVACLVRKLPSKWQPLTLLGCVVLAALSNQATSKWKNDEVFFSAMLQGNPTSFSAHNGLGTTALSQGDALKALGHYEAALVQQPTNVLALANLGLALARLGRFSEVLERVAPLVPGEEQIKRSPLSVPGIARMLEVIGFSQVQLNQAAAGLASYQHAYILDPNNQELAANVARLQGRVSDLPTR